MKWKFIKSLLLLFIVLATACGKDEKVVQYTALPEKAQMFVKSYFPTTDYARIVQEKDDGTTEYEVYLSDGTELDFDKQGEWKSIDCKFAALPAGILPETIMTDIATRYPQAVAYKVEKQLGGYEIDIPGWELYYSQQGTFIRAEMD